MTYQELKAKAASGPWIKGGEYSGYMDEISCHDGRAVALVWVRRNDGRGASRQCFKDDPEGMANASLLCHCVNNFDALVASSKRLLACPALNLDGLEPEDLAAIEEAKSAIAAAEEVKGIV